MSKYSGIYRYVHLYSALAVPLNGILGKERHGKVVILSWRMATPGKAR